MATSSIRAQYAIIAEYNRVGERGKVDLLGLFDRVFAQSVPAQHQELVFSALLVTDSEDGCGRHRATLRFVDPKRSTLFDQTLEFEMKPEGGTWLGSARLAFQMKNLPLPDYGKYFFRLLVDDAEVAQHPLSVVRER